MSKGATALKRRLTLVEIAEGVAAGELDERLGRASGNQREDEQPFECRRWRQLQPFNHADFDIEAYLKSLTKD